MKTNIQLQSHEIIYLKGVENYTELHFANGKSMLSSYTLLYHQQRLEGFLRVSKNHLLNPEFIAKVNLYGTEREVQLKSGKWVRVSRRRKNYIRQSLPYNLQS